MKKVFFVFIVLVSGLICNVRADQDVSDTQHWNGLNITGETLTIGPGGNLTVDAPEQMLIIANGGRIVVNGGTLTMNAGDEGRVSMDANAEITVNSGYVEVNAGAGIKFPDTVGPCRINVQGGTLRVSYMEVAFDRDPLITIGGGLLEVDRVYLDDPERRDPQNWLSAGVLVPAAGYDQIVINPDNGQGFVEVSASGGPQGCVCPGDLTEDGQIDLDDLQAVASILLEAGSPFVVQVEPGHCGDLNGDEQLDLDDLQQVAALLLQAGSPFVVLCR